MPTGLQILGYGNSTISTMLECIEIPEDGCAVIAIIGAPHPPFSIRNDLLSLIVNNGNKMVGAHGSNGISDVRPLEAFNPSTNYCYLSEPCVYTSRNPISCFYMNKEMSTALGDNVPFVSGLKKVDLLGENHIAFLGSPAQVEEQRAIFQYILSERISEARTDYRTTPRSELLDLLKQLVKCHGFTIASEDFDAFLRSKLLKAKLILIEADGDFSLAKPILIRLWENETAYAKQFFPPGIQDSDSFLKAVETFDI